MWIADHWEALPTNEWLLTLADHCHNRMGNRGFGTFAVGAVGETPLKVRLVVGVNSSVFHETKLTPDQNVPPAVRNAIELASMVMTKEPYHAEVSCVLWAKNNGMTLYAVASSRKVCGTCLDFLNRHVPNAQIVDMWQRQQEKNTDEKIYLTQDDRKEVNLGDEWINRMRLNNLTATYSAKG